MNSFRKIFIAFLILLIATAIATSDRELLRLGFTINGITDALAAVGDIQIVNKNLLVCNGASCPADNFANLTPSTGNVYVGGKVGIGTTNPTENLHLNGGDLLITSDGSVADGTINTYTEGLTITGNNMRLVVDTSSVINGGAYIQARHQSSSYPTSYYNLALNPLGGNVGIGTTTPPHPLSVVKDVAGNVDPITSFLNPSLPNGNYVYSGIGKAISINNAGLFGFTQDATSSRIWLGIWGDDTSGGVGLTVKKGGNVGIGTNAPQHPLSVGTAAGDGQSITIRGYSDTPTSWKGGAAFGYSSGSVIMGQLNGVAQIGGHNAGITAWANLAINSGGGNVGIGTTNPVEKLEINGNLRFTAANPTISVGGYFHAPGGAYFNSGTVYTVATIQARGGVADDGGDLNLLDNVYISGTPTSVGNMWINNSQPTLYFKDTDGRGVMLHNNSNYFYMLRGCEATNSTYWCQYNGVWPFTLNLGTNAISTGGAITATSDIRLKTNITPLPEDTMDKVKQLRGVYFNWIVEADMGDARQIGVIAQEVEKIFPELVTTSADGYKAVSYSRLNPILIEAIKQQEAEIESLIKQKNDIAQRIINIESKLR